MVLIRQYNRKLVLCQFLLSLSLFFAWNTCLMQQCCPSFGVTVVTAQKERYGKRRSSSRRRSSFEDEEVPPFSKDNNGNRDQAQELVDVSKLKLNAPKHLVQGLFQGLGIAISGVFGGVSMPLLFPFVLFMKNREQGKGIQNILLGGFVGSVAGLFVSAGSILLGGVQIVRSIVPTWHALRSDRDGTIYRDGSWVPYSLQKEEDSIGVTNLLFYNLLEVSSKASTSQIKRAFREKARTIHPDKQPKELKEDAANQFRQLTSAYETLVDPSRRRFYDLHGTSNNNSPANDIQTIHEDDTSMKAPIDTIAFFHILFGMVCHNRSSRKNDNGLTSYVGELRLGSDFSVLMQSMKPKGMTVDPSTVQNLFSKNHQLQTKRQLDIALFLQKRIAPYITNNGTMNQLEFQQLCREEAESFLLTGDSHQDKASQVLTEQYVFEIGKALKMEADDFLSSSSSLSSFNNSFIDSLGQIQGLLWGTSFKAISYLTYDLPKRFSMFLSLGKYIYNILFRKEEDETSLWEKIWTQMKKMQRGAGESLQNEEIVENVMSRLDVIVPSSLELVWKFVKNDIQTTLRSASRKLFIDSETPYLERIERAKAVRLLGREFIRAAKNNPQKSNPKIQVEEYFGDFHDIIARIKVAFTASVRKASTGQDIPSAAEREAEIQVLREQQENAKSNSYTDSHYWFSQYQSYDASY